jgi:hypothetical protein
MLYWLFQGNQGNKLSKFEITRLYLLFQGNQGDNSSMFKIASL